MSLEIREERNLLGRPLRRSLHQRVLAGVCGGLAEWIGWDVTVVRLVVVALALVTSVVPVALAYVLLAFLLPEERPHEAYMRWWRDSESW